MTIRTLVICFLLSTSAFAADNHYIRDVGTGDGSNWADACAWDGLQGNIFIQYQPAGVKDIDKSIYITAIQIKFQQYDKQVIIAI